MLSRRQVDYTSGLIVLVTALAGVVALPGLPDQVAIHFSASGTPDTFVPPLVAVLLLPAIMVFTYLFLRYAPTFDPTANIAVLRVTTLATMALLGAIHVIVLAWNLGYPINIDLILPGVIVWTILVVGYALYKERF